MNMDMAKLVSEACDKIVKNHFEKAPNESLTIKTLVEQVAKETSVPTSVSRALVQVWCARNSEQYHTEKGPKGGLKQGKPTAKGESGKKNQCPCCGTGLRDARFAALSDLFKKYPDVAAVIGSHPDLSKDLAKFVKNHADDETEDTSVPPTPEGQTQLSTNL